MLVAYQLVNGYMEVICDFDERSVGRRSAVFPIGNIGLFKPHFERSSAWTNIFFYAKTNEVVIKSQNCHPTFG